jgi:alginate O-acetyltransferase complex protein AlgI
MSEFWQRWHISLSSWLRDYVFTPLGSFRRGTWQSYRNLFVTMTVGGLWHGANWTFVVFGMLHGLILVAHRVFQHFCRKRRWPNLLLANPSGAAFCVVVTFLTFSISLVVFRASTLATAATMLRGLLGSSGMMSSPMREFSLWWIAAVVALCHGLAASGTWRRMAGVLPAPVLGCGYAMVLTLTLVLAPQANQAFIYFQF